MHFKEPIRLFGKLAKEFLLTENVTVPTLKPLQLINGYGNVIFLKHYIQWSVWYESVKCTELLFF